MENKRLLYNAIKTPDGTILESKYTHDYVSYKDKNGQYYCVDGGLSYLKRSYDKHDFEELSEYDNGDHEKRRRLLRWGSNYDKNMNRLPETIYRNIIDMDNDHIKSILDGNWCKSELYLEVFKNELKFREVNNQLELKL